MNSLNLLIENHGSSELHCLQEYVKSTSNTEIGKFEEAVTNAVEAVIFICRTITALNQKLQNVDYKITPAKNLLLMQRAGIDIAEKLLTIRWVNTPIFYSLLTLKWVFKLSVDKDMALKSSSDPAQLSSPKLLLLPYRSLVIGSLLDRVLHIVHLDNFKEYLPRVYTVALIAHQAPTHLARNLPLAAITVLDDINDHEEMIRPMLRYMIINIVFEFTTKPNHFESSFTLPNVLSCLLKFGKHPTELEYHTFKCLALLGSLNTTGNTEIVRIYPFLLDKNYSSYQPLLLKWLERIFNNNRSNLWVHKKICRSFMNSRSFRSFLPCITKHIEQSSRGVDISDEAKHLISFLSSLTISFKISEDLKETLVLISFYKNDDYMVLNFLLENYCRLRDQIETQREMYVSLNPELAQASHEKQLLAAVLDNNELEYESPNLKDIDTLKYYFVNDFDVLDQASCPEPRVHMFPSLALYAKIGSLLYWLASEDLECNDLIKDDIDDLTTPILAFCKFMVFEPLRMKFVNRNGVSKTDYDVWSGFTENNTNNVSDDDEIEENDKSASHNGKIFLSQADSCPSTSLRMLRLIGKLNVVTKKARSN